MHPILQHWTWVFPLAGAISWGGMLIALISCWALQGHPRYSFLESDKNIVFISDVAATNLQPIFIACASFEALCYVISVISERYLRHSGRLLPNYRRREKVLAGCAIGAGIIGQLGIIFVSCFNTVLFSSVHMSMLCVFLGGVGLSAFCTICEFAILDHSYSRVNRLRISYALKSVWFLTALALAIAFGYESLSGSKNVAAVLEWCLAFSWTFYLLTLVYDLAPAAKTQKGQLLEKKLGLQLNRVASHVPGMSMDEDRNGVESDQPVTSEVNRYNVHNYNHNTGHHQRDVSNLGDDSRQDNSASMGYKHSPAEVV